MNDYQKNLLEHWDAWIYEQDEDESVMAQYLVRMAGEKPLRIFEAACGGGKLCVPLAQAGHEVTGMDRNDRMLEYARRQPLPNLHLIQADMLSAAWGGKYDLVVLGANLLVNIVTDRDYKRAQKNLLERAHEALKPGGRLFIDFDCPLTLAAFGSANTEWVCFEGTDDWGTYGRYIVMSGRVSESTRLVSGARRWEIAPKQGEQFTLTQESCKYFPTLEQVCAWLYRIGFTVESVNGGYQGEPFDTQHRRAVIWARKVEG